METAMSNKARNTSGKFAPKSEIPRKVRSVNLTDNAWHWLADVAEKAGMSRNDYLEALAEGSNPFMEIAGAKPSPIMETVECGTETSDAQITKQPDIEVVPIMETVQPEIESLKQSLENSDHLIRKLKEDVQKLRSQLATEKTWYEELDEQYAGLEERYKELDEKYDEVVTWWKEEEAKAEKLQSEFTDLKQKSAPIAITVEFPEPAIILSQLRAKRKKSKADLADIEAILEMIER